jgi:hypothetical protein
MGYRVYPIELDGTFLTLAEIFKQNAFVTGRFFGMLLFSCESIPEAGFPEEC